MSLELDKLAEEVQRRIKQISLDNNSTNAADNTDSKLSSAETQDLNKGLSGELITAGFSDNDAEQLTEGLSGLQKQNTDSLEYSETNNSDTKSEVPFSNQNNERFLDLTLDSINYYIKQYPNVSKAYLKSNIVFLLDNQGNLIKDSSGNPVTINYTQGTELNIDLISFYLNHNSGQLDIYRIFELQELQKQINSSSQSDKKLQELMSEAEIQKLEMMGDTERKHYVTTKMWNAFNSGDKSEKFNVINNFIEYKCRFFAKKSGKTNIREFLNDKTYLNNLVVYIDKVIGGNIDKLTKNELMWEIIKEISDAIDLFIEPQDSDREQKTDNSIETLPLNPKIKHLINGAIQAFFGNEGLALIKSRNTQDSTTEGVVLSNQHHNEFTASNGKLFIEGFKGLDLKDFRLRISEAITLNDLDEIRNLIDQSSFSKPEKQMLRNECAKQQGIIQKANPGVNLGVNLGVNPGVNPGVNAGVNNNISNTVQKNTANSLNRYDSDKEKAYSQLAYTLFRECKTPSQREMAKIILNDSRLCNEYQNNILILKDILENCETQEYFAAKKCFIEKIFENPIFTDKNEVFDENLMRLIAKITPENLNIYLELLDLYNNSTTGLDKYIFAQCAYLIYDNLDAIENLVNIINNQTTTDILNTLKETNLDIIKSIISFAKEGKYAELPLEEALSNYNIRIIGSVYTYGENRQEILNLQKNILSKNDFIKTKEPVLIRSGESETKIDYALFIKNLLEELQAATELYRQDDLINFVENVLTDKNLGMDAKALSALSEIVSNTSKYKLNKAKSYNFELFSYMCQKQDFTSNNVITILERTPAKYNDFTKKILEKNNITAQEKTDIISNIDFNNPEQMRIVESLLSEDTLNLKVIPKILEVTKIIEAKNTGGNNKIDSKKVDKYLRLLQNPKTRDWTIQMLSENYDIETISRLAAAKQDFRTDNKNVTNATDESVIYFMNLGLNQKEADAIVKSISQSGTINTEMQNTAIDLINAGIPKHKIGQILRSATITGEYNSNIPADAMSLNGLGLNAFVERFLPIVNNLSSEDIAKRLDYKTRKQLKNMIENISESTKPALCAKGFDLKGISEKLGMDDIPQA